MMSGCHIGCIICIGCLCLLSNVQLGNCANEVAGREPYICQSLDVRNKVDEFKELENCTVIEGYLKILLIDRAGPEDYEGLQFPKLVEITGYLLLYRVYGLKTLKDLFPNLAVIRGQELFFDYALVAFEMPSLEELGLTGLTTILRGAVRLEKNSKLCYINTIDWSLIVNSRTSPEDHYFALNRNTDECVNVCPKLKTCPERTVVPDENLSETRNVCWTSSDCQIVCPSNCQYCNTSIKRNGKPLCCDPQCIGGCYGDGPTQCVACKHFYYQGRCQSKCPPSTYEFQNRRCVQKEECRDMETSKKKKFVRWKTFNKTCIKECPVGYTEDDQKKWECKKCEGPCPKECSGTKIDSIATAQRLKGCTVIKGNLEIQIRGGKNIAKELEDNLGLIEVVSQYVKVTRSHALISLSFLKSLRVIMGEQKEGDKYSLFILDNQNLQEIWNFTTHPNLTIQQGKMFFHFNSKLCLNKIYSLAQQVGITDWTPEEISDKTNGDQVACNISQLQVNLVSVGGTYVIMKWKRFMMDDRRQLIGYTVYYREAPKRNVSIYSERDACGNDIWKMEDILEKSPVFVYHILTELKPWTQYAVYVQTYTVASSNVGAMSELVYFKTDPEVPTHPRDLIVDSKYPEELHVRWKAPSKPNGNVTHYYVYWSPQPLHSIEYDRRNYCTDKRSFPSKSRMRVKDDHAGNKTSLQKCCACPKTEKEKRIEEAERRFQIEFENYLHNYVYQKRLVKNTKAVSSDVKPKRPRRSAMELSSTPASDVRNTSLVVYGNGTYGNGTDDEEEEEEYLAAVVYNKHEIILPNLRHFQTYSIEVVACQEYDPKTEKKRCSNRAIITAITKPSPDADIIDHRNVTAIAVSESSVEISWPDPVKPNGLVVTYEIKYTKWKADSNIKPVFICIPHVLYRKKRGYTLKNLPDGNYTYQIRATSLGGNGTWTRKMSFKLEKPGEKDDPYLQRDLVALIVTPILLFIILIVAGIVWYFVKKRMFTNIPDNMYVSVNPEYLYTGEVYEPDEWEVDRDKIKLIRELGQGSFGMVYEGNATGLMNTDGEVRVAVKTVNESASMRDRLEFLNEASVMKAFCCNHVVKLLGVVSKGQPTLVVMELMANGDLKNYLRMHRPDAEDNAGRQPPSLKRILQMAGEIADGMSYLAAKKFVHRDLAARNCMVAEDLTVKIGDFGMTRDIYETDYYKKGGKGLLPVRWMSPESLKDGVFTSTSDVWSYGVVLWEMATLAAQPYQGLSNEQVLKYVIDGGLMEKPEGCPDKLFDLMTWCWRFHSKQRPTFNEIIEDLVPDLSPHFMQHSYFFSDSNRHHDPVEEATAEECCPLTADVDPSIVMMSTLGDEHHSDPEMGLQCNHISNSPKQGNSSRNSNSSNSLAENPKHKSKEKRPANCSFKKSSPSSPSRKQNSSSVSSPSSSDGSKSDGSKASMKSNGSVYSHMNGVANGHINSPMTRTTEC